MTAAPDESLSILKETHGRLARRHDHRAGEPWGRPTPQTVASSGRRRLSSSSATPTICWRTTRPHCCWTLCAGARRPRSPMAESSFTTTNRRIDLSTDRLGARTAVIERPLKALLRNNLCRPAQLMMRTAWRQGMRWLRRTDPLRSGLHTDAAAGDAGAYCSGARYCRIRSARRAVPGQLGPAPRTMRFNALSREVHRRQAVSLMAAQAVRLPAGGEPMPSLRRSSPGRERPAVAQHPALPAQPAADPERSWPRSSSGVRRSST